MILPWQQDQWEQITKRYEHNNLPHSIIISGQSGTGKRQFADHLVQYLLCQGEKICGNCHGCLWLKASSHPDYFNIEPEEGKSSISINQIRDVVTKLHQTANAGGYQVVVIHPADKMTISASNALLKTLEEPSGKVVLILVSDHVSRLLKTIISRCQLIKIPEPTHACALQWLNENLEDASQAERLLELADGRALMAKRYSEQGIIKMADEQEDQLMKIYHGSENPLKIAAQWNKEEPIIRLELLSLLVMNMIRAKVIETKNARIKALSAHWEERDLFDYLTTVQQKLSLLRSHANPNTQLLIEGLLVQ